MPTSRPFEMNFANHWQASSDAIQKASTLRARTGDGSVIKQELQIR